MKIKRSLRRWVSFVRASTFLSRSIGDEEERERRMRANVQDDWDVSDSEKTKKTAAPTTTAAPPKKKLTLKQKLAEKERLAAERVSPSAHRPGTGMILEDGLRWDKC
jgi:hypothetical protein